MTDMHGLTSVTIENYRSCKETQLSLSSLTPVVGENNAGKSNILSAVAWLVAPCKLTDRDLFAPGSPVVVTATIEGLSAEVLAQLGANHRKRVEPFLEEGRLCIRRSGDANEAVRTFTLELKKPGAEGDWEANPTGIASALKRLFPQPVRIRAMEDAVEDAAKSKATNTIGQLLKLILKEAEGDYSSELSPALDSIRSSLSADGDKRPSTLSSFDDAATSSVQDFFRGIEVRFHVPTPSVVDLLSKGTIRVYERGEARDLSTLGHGAQRSVQMALVRLLADKNVGGVGGGSRHLLLIDEPELYLHPQAVEHVAEALEKLSAGAYQVLFSTHSALLVTQTEIANAAVVYKSTTGSTEVRSCLREAVKEAVGAAPHQAELLLSLSSSPRILFSQRVLLTEGKTERRILPALFRAVTGKRFRYSGLGLVSQGGIDNLSKTSRILNSLGLPWKAVADLDFAFRGALDGGLLDSGDEDVAALKDVLKQLENEGTIELGDTGLPKRSKSLGVSAPKAYEMLHSQPGAAPHLKSLHDKLEAQGVWLWTRGAIEPHLGLDGKKEPALAAKKAELDGKPLVQAVADPRGVEDFVKWLNS